MPLDDALRSWPLTLRRSPRSVQRGSYPISPSRSVRFLIDFSSFVTFFAKEIAYRRSIGWPLASNQVGVRIDHGPEAEANCRHRDWLGFPASGDCRAVFAYSAGRIVHSDRIDDPFD